MERREFIKSGCTACLSAIGIAGLLSSCKVEQYVKGEFNKDGLFINSTDFIQKVSNTGDRFHKYLIVKNDELKYPIYLYRQDENNYSALWMQCTHQGAALQASGEFLQCPAHGSEFDRSGKVTSGPADRNLRTFPVTVIDRRIFIDLRKR